jgi:predicted Co/Zn/Cd cation transporter (cation efflux family)
MSEKQLSPQERAQRGKRLLLYGMFALVVVTFLSVFLTVYLLTGALTGGAGVAFQSSLIVTVIAVVACVIVWFVYTKAILKE